MEENVTIMTVLQELREFRSENNKRWEENDRRWEENNKCWEENDKRWEENNIDFRIYLYLNDLKIIGGHIFKYRILSQSEHFKQTGYESEATQQELLIVKRVLSFILEEQ